MLYKILNKQVEIPIYCQQYLDQTLYQQGVTTVDLFNYNNAI